MAELRKCSRCRSEILTKYFAINRKGEYNKTCETCLNKKRKNMPILTTPNDLKPLERTDTDFDGGVDKETLKQTTVTSFIEHYINLPIIKLEEKQNKDMQIDDMLVLNHCIEFEPKLKRYDKQRFTYKEFTELDSVEYAKGTDPMLDYMPDEYVTPVLVRINGVMYRASCLTWFPLTDCADAIKLKQYETKQKVFPIYIKQGQSPIPTIANATGYKYHQRLPSTKGFLLHQGYQTVR